VKRLHPDPADARFVRRVLILLVVGGVVVALYRASDLLILVFGSVLGAIAIQAIVDAYAGWGLPRRLRVPAAMASVLAAIGFFVWLFAVQFGPQIEALIEALPGLVDRLRRWAAGSPVTAKLYDAAEAAFAGSRVAQDASGLALGSGELLLNAILLLVGALFIAADPGAYRRGLLLLVPAAKRDMAADALDDVEHTLRLWLRAQIILMTSMGVLVALGLWLAGVPSPAALGFLAGLSEFIPYVGPAAAMLPALGLAATAGPGTLVGCLITFAAVRLFQTNPRRSRCSRSSGSVSCSACSACSFPQRCWSSYSPWCGASICARCWASRSRAAAQSRRARRAIPPQTPCRFPTTRGFAGLSGKLTFCLQTRLG
jgi:predicted PurR-regulated permease PerM